MDRDYINAVSKMIQQKMEPNVKAAFKRTEERFKNKEPDITAEEIEALRKETEEYKNYGKDSI